MNYYEIFGETISKEDEAFINEVERFVNGRMTNPQKIGKGLSTMHRYFQHQAFKIVVAYMRQLALNFHAGRFDDRNEWAAKAAATAYDSLVENEIVWDTEYTERKG